MLPHGVIHRFEVIATAKDGRRINAAYRVKHVPAQGRTRSSLVVSHLVAKWLASDLRDQGLMVSVEPLETLPPELVLQWAIYELGQHLDDGDTDLLRALYQRAERARAQHRDSKEA